MKGKSLFVIVATIVFVWSLWSGAMGALFEKIGYSDGPSIIKIDKNSKEAVVVQRYLGNASALTSKISESVFADMGGNSLIQKCKDDPVLFGALFVFLGASACSIAFVVYLIRSDARF